jgi:hypothetical protein
MPVLIALAIGLVVWCVWRFFKKKRPKDKKKGKDGKEQVNNLNVVFCSPLKIYFQSLQYNTVHIC